MAAAAVSCAGGPAPEITWSLMHPTRLDTVYMQRVIRESEGHHVDNYEICGACNSGCDGSLDGLLLFEEYPEAASRQNIDEVLHNRKSLARIVEMSHGAGKKVYYWHREVLCNDGVLVSFPGLLDQDGEFDLLGEAYERFLRYKIRKAFEAVPDLDGIVLTLTEASFSALHNSRPDKYPPAKVVEKVGGIFAEELESRGKRFILRSFGSIKEDYEAIAEGARALAKSHRFEVETKITPYDFDPFLPDNMFLEKIPGCTMGAECDVLGEFLGCGRMLPEQVDEAVRYVRYARKKKVDRFTLRLDRKGCSVFDVYPVNLYAYEQAITHPGKSARRIRREYYSSMYPDDVADALVQVSRDGMECVRKTEFIDGNLIFHWFPTDPDLKLLKAGGILSAFAPSGDLSRTCRQWAMLSDRKVPGHDAILREKAAAVEIAGRNLSRVQSLAERLDSADRGRLLSAWKASEGEAVSLLELSKVICAYFEDMQARDTGATTLKKAFEGLQGRLEGVSMLRPVPEIAARFMEDYPAELSLRRRFDGNCLDCILPGSVTDQVRTEHYMHGCYCSMADGVPVVTVGNPVYPDAYLAMRLKGTEEPVVIEVRGSGTCRVSVNGSAEEYVLDGGVRIQAPACSSGYELSLTRVPGAGFPMVESVSMRSFKDFVRESLDAAATRAWLMYEKIGPMDGLLPDRTDVEGNFIAARPMQWTAGFFPGTLWYLYAHTGSDAFRKAAVEMTGRMEGEQFDSCTHDIGFKIGCSFGQAWKYTGDEGCANTVVQAARTLSGRFSPVVDCFRSWDSRAGKDWDFIVIIDNMMNLELMMEAARISGDATLSDMALRHAERTLRNHFRPDGSSFHVVNYDSSTGEVLSRNTAQGLSDSSAWARGQAWALYGYTMMYRETGKKEFLRQAEKVAGFILHHPAMPSDGIPYWDFDAPADPSTPRDVSAAAVICSASLELAGLSKDAGLSAELLSYARKVLVSLSAPEYLAEPGTNGCFMLKHSTINLPSGNYDTAVVYADYYYVESLMRCL